MNKHESQPEESDDMQAAGNGADQLSIDWQTIFNAVDTPISVQDIQSRVLWTNEAYAEMFGRARGEPVGKKCFEPVHGTRKPWPDCVYGQTLSTGESGTADFFYPCTDKHFRISTYPLLDSEGCVSHHVHFINDITLQKQAEEIHMQYEQMEALLAVVRSICHELGQPMQTVAGYSELLLMRMAEDDPLYQQVQILRREVDRMAQIATKLAYTARNGMRDNIADRRPAGSDDG